MNIKKFISLAIQGGWNVKSFLKMDEEIYKKYKNDDVLAITISKAQALFAEILLDPEAWKAVGKTIKKWQDKDEQNARLTRQAGGGEMITGQYMWNKMMHRFIDALCEGKTIEEAIKEI